MISQIKTYLSRYAAYKQTVKELSSMSDRQLSDLGISRYEIDLIAIESAKLVAPVTEPSKISFSSFFKKQPAKSQEAIMVDRWLADSLDLVDLERRQRLLEQGKAPWQLNARASSWV